MVAVFLNLGLSESKVAPCGWRCPAPSPQLSSVCVCVCVCETYTGKPFGTRVVPQFTTEVAKPLTQ
jgi:hypothetical protein